MPAGDNEKKKFAFAYGSTYAWNAISASSNWKVVRMSLDPNSYGFARPALPRKLPMTEVSGLKTFDAPGFGTLFTVWTSVSAFGAGACVGVCSDVAAVGAVTGSMFVRSSLAGGGGGPPALCMSS